MKQSGEREPWLTVVALQPDPCSLTAWGSHSGTSFSLVSYFLVPGGGAHWLLDYEVGKGGQFT